MKKNKIDVIIGNGKALKNKKVEVTAADGKVSVYDAKNVMIATGGRARALPNIPIDGVKVVEYRKAMTLENQPKSMVIIGSGAIGVEFAYVYAAMGTKVTIVEFMPNIVPVEDEEVSMLLWDIAGEISKCMATAGRGKPGLGQRNQRSPRPGCWRPERCRPSP